MKRRSKKNGVRRRFFLLKLRLLGVTLLLFLLSSCQSLKYYAQAIHGDLSIRQSQRPIEHFYQDSATAKEKHKIKVIKSALVFAKSIGLAHDNQYLDIATSVSGPVVWNVIATRPYSFDPLQHCFPWLGCVAYRGYFQKEDADNYSLLLQQQGYDVAIQGAAAYSTLGFFADPILASFLTYDDLSLARLLFHELTHASVYLPGGAETNESFASVLEYEALRQWLHSLGQAHLYKIALAQKKHDDAVYQLLSDYQQKLTQLYERSQSAIFINERKGVLLDRMKSDYRHLASLHQDSRYDAWFDRPLNNANFVSMNIYHGRRDVFEWILKGCHNDLPCYLSKAKEYVNASN